MYVFTHSRIDVVLPRSATIWRTAGSEFGMTNRRFRTPSRATSGLASRTSTASHTRRVNTQPTIYRQVF